MKTYLTAVIGAALAACCTLAPAQQCEEVTVGVVPQHVQFHFDQSIHQLTQQAGAVGRAAILGLYSVQPHIEQNECHFTVRFEAHLYVARELTKDACSFSHVLRHEQEHATIWAESQVGLAERMEGLANVGVYPIEHVLSIALMDAWRRNREHDSPEEYAKNATVCDGYINDVVNNYRMGNKL